MYRKVINIRNWFYSAQDRNYWRALANAALNLRVSYAMFVSWLVQRRDLIDNNAQLLVIVIFDLRWVGHVMRMKDEERVKKSPM